jgi:hypothetical protein
MEKRRLREIEEYVFDLFQRRQATRLLTRDVFESTNEYANADLVRAFEDLEKRQRLLARYTDEGNDWIRLTPEGARYAGLIGVETVGEPVSPPHPPKSSTQ